ncbi:MAG: site-specific integrase [Ignavibacteriales bacterium]|nr:site-specific integrase [Ignavibacteriales bacterium]
MTLSEGTLALYNVAFKNMLKVVGDLKIEQMTALHWEQYKRVRSSKVSPVTTNIELRSLKAAMNRAVDWKLLPSNPFYRQKLCMVPESVPTFFSVDDFERLIQAIRDLWFRRIAVFGVLTGMRRSEIVNLQWCDIDFSQKTIRIQSSGDFKTKAGKRRVIAVGETVIEVLAQIRPASVENTTYVFTLKGEKIKPVLLTKKLKRAVKKSKVENQRLHFHSLRHTFASWLAQKGTSIYEIQKLLGHTDIKTTQIYAHLLPNELHKTVNQLEGMVAPLY